MKKASIVMPNDFYNNNRLFDLKDKDSNRDNCLYPYTRLKEKLFENGYHLATSDINHPSESDIIIYNEVPKVLPKKDEIDKSYLLLFESELIKPDNWILESHRFFKKIFTWNDEYIFDDRYVKFNFPNEIQISDLSSERNKFCTLIAGNKKSDHPLELYSKRVEVIRWFEKEHPEDFEFYGVGWDTFVFGGSKFYRALNRIKPLGRLVARKFPSYKGMIQNKNSVLGQYRFAICFENARDFPGYITEKIFDCFFAGCIPIYWGANNISDHIPEACYIDFTSFSSLDEMYKFINEMSDITYVRYLENIRDFLQSEFFYPFSSEYFANSIVDTILRHVDV